MPYAKRKTFSIDRYGTRAIIRDMLLVLIHAIILFWAAGTLRWLNAWVYLILVLLQQATLTVVLIRQNPRLLNERGRTVKEGTILFDKFFVVIFCCSSLIISTVAGMDAVRFQWFQFPQWLIIPGSAVFISSSLLGTWAMSVNSHFEMTIRIQEDRQHAVCDSGPYRYIRHPGYASWIMAALSYPLILGSAASIIPVTLLIAVFIARTAVEDRFLQQKLEGYEQYMANTRFRLIPYIW